MKNKYISKFTAGMFVVEGRSATSLEDNFLFGLHKCLVMYLQPVFSVPLLSQASLHQQSWLLQDDKTAAKNSVKPDCVTVSLKKNA